VPFACASSEESRAVTRRLAQQRPALAEPLSRLSPEHQASVAERAADLAVLASGVSIPARGEAALAASVGALDEIAWDLQDADNEAYLSAFARARAANAVLFAVQGEAAEAIYEAAASLGEDAAILAMINAG
jgi:hypothetical protein